MSSPSTNQNAPIFQPLFSTFKPCNQTLSTICATSSTSLTCSLFPSVISKHKQPTMSSNPGSGASTPNPRFTPQAKTIEDVLSTQTVGLVALSDFRKRRAEALEQKERDAQELLSGGSGRGTPGNVTPDG
jgi:hypothetical protein